MGKSSKFKTGERIFVIDCEEILGHIQCPTCEGFGTIRVDRLEIEDIEKYFTDPANNTNSCPRCHGAGRIINVERKTDWEIVGMYSVDSVHGSVKKEKFETEEVLCDVRYEKTKKGLLAEEEVSESFDLKNCFRTLEEAERAIDERNFVVLYSVEFAGNHCLFEDIDEVLLRTRNYMVNSAKKFNPDHQHVDDEDLMGNKGKARFSELQNECGEKGFTIGVVNVNRLDFNQVINFGGVKVISGMPVYVDILFMDKIVETSNEESTKKPPLVPKPEFIKEKE